MKGRFKVNISEFHKPVTRRFNDEVPMLVTFRSKASADVVMFGDMAIKLLALMGHAGTVPGAILAEDVDAALSKLKQAIKAAEAAPAGNEYSPIRTVTRTSFPSVSLIAPCL